MRKATIHATRKRAMLFLVLILGGLGFGLLERGFQRGDAREVAVGRDAPGAAAGVADEAEIGVRWIVARFLERLARLVHIFASEVRARAHLDADRLVRSRLSRRRRRRLGQR